MKSLVYVLIACIALGSPVILLASNNPDDNSIAFWVREAILEDPHVNAPRIGVEVENGIVTLSGEVRSITAKQYALRETRKIVGVLGIIDKIQVNAPRRLDADITADVRARIADDAAINSHGLLITCRDGVVELQGEVANWFEYDEAGLVTGEVRGVTHVNNYLKVHWTTARSDQDIKNDATASLDRDVYLTDRPITVHVHSSTVTLTGTVGSQYEKDRAFADVHWIDAVCNVDNELVVDPDQDESTPAETKTSTNFQVSERVRLELLLDKRLNLENFAIITNNGHVILKGSVADSYQRQIAAMDARNVIGVYWVQNELIPDTPTRDDAVIYNDIIKNLSMDSILANQAIEVGVDNGVVTLSGRVQTSAQRLHAREVADRIRGVNRIENQLEVSWIQATDAEITVKVTKRLTANWLLSSVYHGIRVEVHDGVVVLTGTVDNWQQRHEAETLALQVQGVRLVVNKLMVAGYAESYVNEWPPAPENGNL